RRAARELHHQHRAVAKIGQHGNALDPQHLHVRVTLDELGRVADRAAQGHRRDRTDLGARNRRQRQRDEDREEVAQRFHVIRLRFFNRPGYSAPPSSCDWVKTQPAGRHSPGAIGGFTPPGPGTSRSPWEFPVEPPGFLALSEAPYSVFRDMISARKRIGYALGYIELGVLDAARKELAAIDATDARRPDVLLAWLELS